MSKSPASVLSLASSSSVMPSSAARSMPASAPAASPSEPPASPPSDSLTNGSRTRHIRCTRRIRSSAVERNCSWPGPRVSARVVDERAASTHRPDRSSAAWASTDRPRRCCRQGCVAQARAKVPSRISRASTRRPAQRVDWAPWLRGQAARAESRRAPSRVDAITGRCVSCVLRQRRELSTSGGDRRASRPRRAQPPRTAPLRAVPAHLRFAHALSRTLSRASLSPSPSTLAHADAQDG